MPNPDAGTKIVLVDIHNNLDKSVVVPSDDVPRLTHACAVYFVVDSFPMVTISTREVDLPSMFASKRVIISIAEAEYIGLALYITKRPRIARIKFWLRIIVGILVRSKPPAPNFRVGFESKSNHRARGLVYINTPGVVSLALGSRL
eukprot:scaffold289202_cov37-Prasinocladus_malaysianus.AAC.1